MGLTTTIFNRVNGVTGDARLEEIARSRVEGKMRLISWLVIKDNCLSSTAL